MGLARGIGASYGRADYAGVSLVGANCAELTKKATKDLDPILFKKNGRVRGHQRRYYKI